MKIDVGLCVINQTQISERRVDQRDEKYCVIREDKRLVDASNRVSMNIDII